jgi:hypothetical protein
MAFRSVFFFFFFFFNSLVNLIVPRSHGQTICRSLRACSPKCSGCRARSSCADRTTTSRLLRYRARHDAPLFDSYARRFAYSRLFARSVSSRLESSRRERTTRSSISMASCRRTCPIRPTSSSSAACCRRSVRLPFCLLCSYYFLK